MPRPREKARRAPRSKREEHASQDSASPLLETLLAAIQRKTQEAEDAYRFHRDRIDKLSDPHTPWEERLRLIDELEGAGWAAYKEWPQLKMRWKYGGKEWRISFTEAEWQQLDTLEGEAYSKYLAEIVRCHLERHPEFKGRILADAQALYFLVVWAACQLWAKDEAYGRWLMDEIVRKALGDLRLPINLTRPDQESCGVLLNEDLPHQAYVHLVSGVISPSIRFVEERLDAYWRVCVKNFARRYLKYALRFRKCLDQPGTPQNSDTDALNLVDTLEDVASLESFARVEDGVDAARAISRLQATLTPRQQQILFLKSVEEQNSTANAELARAAGLSRGGMDLRRLTRMVPRGKGEGKPTNPQIATALGVSLSTLEKDLRRIRQLLIALGLTHG